jgi:hypothetical protein
LFDLLETRLQPPEVEVEVEQKKSHKGRWLLFLTALGGGLYALVRMRSQGDDENEWREMGEPPAVTQSGTAAV